MSDQPPLSPELDEIEARLRAYEVAFDLSIGPHVAKDIADAADTIRSLREQVREAKAEIEAITLERDAWADAAQYDTGP